MENLRESYKDPIISFILPVYNSEGTIRSCVKQLTEINPSIAEIILVDDGSTDQSGFICDELAATQRNISCIHQKNQGVASARNHGLESAQGRYVQFIDNDDALEITSLNKILRNLMEHPEVDMAILGLSFDYYHNDSLYRRDEIKPAIPGIHEIANWIDHIPDLYRSNSLSPIWNKIIKRRILTENNLKLRTEMFLYEDLEYSLRIMAKCNNIWFTEDIIYHYRQSEDEGNAGRRLRRVNHISALIQQIETAYKTLYEAYPCTTAEKDTLQVLDSLFQVLAREKINVSSRTGVKEICKDYYVWRMSKYQLSNEIPDKFARKLYGQQVNSLILEKLYTAFRHKVAVKVKSIMANKERKIQ